VGKRFAVPRTMNILVAFGSKHHSTAEIAEHVGETLRQAGHEVDVMSAASVPNVDKYQVVIVGGALYAGRWFRDARQFVIRHKRALRKRHMWCFSSGPLDESAKTSTIAPTPQVLSLMKVVGAHGHMTFGGRLAPDTPGFIESSMAKTKSGDWRDLPQIEAWAKKVAFQLESPPPLAARFKELPSRTVIVIECLFAGVTAVFGGATLVASPDGAIIQMPTSMLVHSPFANFMIPGLILLTIVGFGNCLSGVMHLRRADFAPMASTVTGMGLVVWIVVEMIMLRSVHWLQLGYFALGIAIVSASLRMIREMFPTPPTTPNKHDKLAEQH
jgi:menaquinone-dependent protoporphyrinogen oxidase